MLLRSKKKTAREVSLFEPIGQDKEGNEICLVDVIEGYQPDAVEQMELRDNICKLFAFLDQCLSAKEQEIIRLRYGIGGIKAVTQSEIGERFGISRSYVSRIEKRALRKLRERFVEIESVSCAGHENKVK